MLNKTLAKFSQLLFLLNYFSFKKCYIIDGLHYTCCAAASSCLSQVVLWCK